MKIKNYFLGLTFLLSGISGLKSQELKSSTYGFSIGVLGKHTQWSTGSSFFQGLNEAAPSAWGFGARIGYGFTEKLEVSLAYSKANHLNSDLKNDWSAYSSQMVLLNLRINFGATLKPVRLYLEGGAGQSMLKMDPVYLPDDFYTQQYLLKLSGLALNAGAGLLYYPMRNLAIDLGFFGRFGQYNNITASGIEYDPGEKTDFQFLTTQLGITYYLQ